MDKQQFKNLKVGDKVRIVSVKKGDSWNSDGLMDKWLGKIMTVRENFGYKIKMVEDQKEWSNGWNWYNGMIAEKVVNKEIHITVDGNKTIAVLKEGGKVVKRAEAKCNPEDEFNFEMGASIALKRVFGNDVKVSDDGKVFLYSKDGVNEVNRPVRKGEYVKVVTTLYEDRGIKKGDIFKAMCAPYGPISGGNVDLDNGVIVLMKHLVVLENYKPPKKGKPEFKPHLVSKNTGNYLGVIGDKTNFKDAIGRALVVGDTVELYDYDNTLLGERAIVKDEQRAFVMSIKASSDDTEGTTGEFKIIKKRSFGDIKDGGIVDDVRYIKTEKVGD